MSSYLMFALSIASSCISQYWQKRAALLFSSQPELKFLQKVFSKPIILAVFFLGIGFISWLGVLARWDVSFAYPLLSLNFLIMILVSKYLFSEKIYKRQWIGIIVVMLGIIFVAGAERWIN